MHRHCLRAVDAEIMINIPMAFNIKDNIKNW
jgi:hypothetical protein